MAKFRKKPVVIEAEQWWPGKLVDGVHVPLPGDGEPGVRTLEGYMRVSPGDWIITCVKGEKYPCKPDIFEATYEQAATQQRQPLDAPAALPDEVRTVIESLLETERLAINDYFYDVRGNAERSTTLKRIDDAIAWLDGAGQDTQNTQEATDNG